MSDHGIGADMRHSVRSGAAGMFTCVACSWHSATVDQGSRPDFAQQKRPGQRRNGSCCFFIAKHHSSVDKG